VFGGNETHAVLKIVRLIFDELEENDATNDVYVERKISAYA
jgi:hypothetical protein